MNNTHYVCVKSRLESYVASKICNYVTIWMERCCSLCMRIDERLANDKKQLKQKEKEGYPVPYGVRLRERKRTTMVTTMATMRRSKRGR